MGADLYIDSLFQSNSKKYAKQFHKWAKIRDEKSKGIPEPIKNYLERADAEGVSMVASHARTYIKTFQEMKEAQKKVSAYYNQMYSKGYFRDSYNSSSVMGTLGLSWWSDVTPLLKNGELSPANAKKLIAMINSRKQNLPTKEQLLKRDATVDDNKNTVEAWHQMYKNSKLELIHFLTTAIKMGESISCSL